MRRQCARPSCSAVATATFTFDSNELTVWLDAPHEGNARAGDLCARHARALAPPRGWKVVDRRGDTQAQPLVAKATNAAAPALVPAPAAGKPATNERFAWHPTFERGDSLNGLLDASTPLLSRAFDNVRAG
jgi:Protein of unknown function (DUF3499)